MKHLEIIPRRERHVEVKKQKAAVQHLLVRIGATSGSLGLEEFHV